MPIRLIPVTKDNVREVIALKVAPHQVGFVAGNAVSLAQAYVEPATAWPRAIADGTRIVGFLMVDRTPDPDPRFEGCVFLWRLMIDAAHQGRGHGAAAMAELNEELRTWPGIGALLLSYVPGEHSPEGFYRRLGFVPTGDRTDDGAEIVMRRELSAAVES